MNLRKAVITAAGKNQHTLPLQTFVDRDGQQKSALRIIIEEALSAGAEEIALIICPGDEAAYQNAAGRTSAELHFIEQPQPRGYGDALYRARDFVKDEPFIHLVSDHLYVSRQPQRCAQQLAEIARSASCAVSAVQATRENMLPYYGAVGGKGVPGQQKLYVVDNVLEKPTPTAAEQELLVPGLRAGHYLCFFGLHILTPAVLEILGEQLESRKGENTAPVQLSSALAVLARRERYLACELPGRRYNMGVKFGILMAQLALALAGREREEVLAQIVEILASRHEEG